MSTNSITYNERTVESCSTSARLMRRALAVAEREGIERAKEETDIPGRLIQKWCDDADVKPGKGHTLGAMNGVASPAEQEDDEPEEGGLRFIDPGDEYRGINGSKFLSVYKGSTGNIRLSASVMAMTGFQDGDTLVFAMDDDDDRPHFYFGLGESTCNLRNTEPRSSLEFSCAPMLRILEIYKPEETRRLLVVDEPRKEGGFTLWKAVLLEPNNDQ